MPKSKLETKNKRGRIIYKTTPRAEWFHEILKSRGMTQTSLANKLGFHKSVVSKIIHGKRELKYADVLRLASIFGTSPDELAKHIKIEGVTSNVEEGGQLPLEGWFDGDLILRSARDGLASPRFAPRLQGEPGLRVARIQSSGSRYGGLDGFLVYLREPAKVTGEIFGRLSVVKLSGVEGWRLRVVQRGYKAGRYNLTSLEGSVIESDVAVETTRHVVALKSG